jgi:predicted acyltransferase
MMRQLQSINISLCQSWALATKGAVMRAHHAIVVAAAILLGFGLKLLFFSVPSAEADASGMRSVSIDISQVQQNIKSLPVETLHDMTFVFSNGG